MQTQHPRSIQNRRQLLGVVEAADELGLSHWTLRAWAYSGRISSNKLGSRLMIPRSEIDRIIAESERPRLEPTAA